MLPKRTFLPFSPEYAFAASRVVTINGVTYQPGDSIPKGALSPHRLRMLYEQRSIAPHAPDFLFNGPASSAPSSDVPASDPVGPVEEGGPVDDVAAAADIPAADIPAVVSPPRPRARRQRTATA